MAQGSISELGSALSYQYLSALGYVLSGGLFYVFIAKFLPTYYVGAIALLLAISSLLNILFSFGFPISAQHFVSFNMGRGDITETHSLTMRLIAISVVLSLASIIFTLAASKPLAVLFFHNPMDASLINAASIYIAFGIIFGILHGTTLGLQKFRADALIYLSSASFSYFLGLAMLFVFHSLLYLVIGLTMSYFYGAILYIVVIYRSKPATLGKTRKTTLQLIFSYSWPLILSNLAGYGSQYVDRFVVAYFLNISTLGIYNFVLIVSSSFAFLSGPIINILIPKLSEYYSLNDKEKLRKGVNISSTFLILIYSPLVLGFAAVAPIALALLATSAYLPGYIPLIILLGASSIFILWTIFGSVLSAIRKTKIYIISTSMTLISNIVLSTLLIPRWGMVGAAIANSSVLVFAFIITYYYAIKKETKSFDWATILKLWSSSLAMFALVTFERLELGNALRMLPLYIVTGIIVYLTLINLTHSLSKLNKDEFLSLIPNHLKLRRIARVVLSKAF